MTPEIGLQVFLSLVSAVFAAGGAYAAVRVQLAWLRADVDDLKRLHEPEARHMHQER
jgi:hypothetical protein